MSATLPPRFVDFLKPVDAVSGELGRRQSDATARRIICGEKRLTLLDGKDEGPNSLVSTIASAVRARHAPHLRIIARTEYISDLIELYASLKDLDPLVYHGRMTSSQRREVIQTILRRQAGNEGFLVLATAAIEAGCDLDAHLIVTELCNPDSLVQLAGRLNRRGRMTGAELVVVGERLKPMTADLRDETMERYLSDLKEMGGRFAPEQLSHYFVPPDGDWMSEILFGMLYDYVYEGDLSAKPLWDRGILVTRSWEPAVTLCTGIDQKTGRPVNPVQIGVSRLAKKIGKGFDALKKEKISKYLSISDSGKWHANVERAFFNADRGEEGRWTHYQLKSYPISSYENTLICIIEPEYTDRYFNPILGYIRIPKIFIKSNREGFRQYLDQPVFKKDGCFAFEGNYMKRSARIWYLGAITCR
ncbi:MAG: helicase-related protein, partial [Desulfococcus multivorans]|jgi:CRISPR-associated endonuclease/helicase Cas3|nr:helicase-related protein [Desulfococcus multivorans]